MRWSVLENLCNSGLLEPRHVDVFDESHPNGVRGLESLQYSRGRQFPSDLWLALLRADVPGFRIRNATYLDASVSRLTREHELRWGTAAASEIYWFAKRDALVTKTHANRICWTVCEGSLSVGPTWESAPDEQVILRCTSEGALVVATHSIPHSEGRPDVAAARASGFQQRIFAFPGNLPHALEKDRPE